MLSHSKNPEEPGSIQKKSLNKSTLLLVLCWIVYTCSYIGKLSYSANINQIGIAFDVSYSDAGMVSTFFFFAYGIGQIVNGLLCKRYNVKYVVFASLSVGCAMNLLVAFAPNFAMLKYVWLVNGIAMSFLWATLIRLLSETMKKEHIDRAIVVMGTTVATGTFLVYGISAFFVAVLDYRWTFCLAAFFLITIAVIWLFSFNGLVIPLREECKAEDEAVREDAKKQSVSIPKISAKSLSVLIAILAFFAVVNNFVKDGLTAWTPDILSSLYSTPGWLSILLTLLLPLLAIPGTVAAVKLHKFAKNFVATCTIMFVMSVLLIGMVIGFLSTSAIVVTISCFALISSLMSGIDNIIVSMVPLQMKASVNSGKLAGVLNGFCYLGSTISSYGLGFVADHWGWSAVFYVLLAVTCLVVATGIVYLIVSHRNEH